MKNLYRYLPLAMAIADGIDGLVNNVHGNLVEFFPSIKGIKLRIRIERVD